MLYFLGKIRSLKEVVEFGRKTVIGLLAFAKRIIVLQTTLNQLMAQKFSFSAIMSIITQRHLADSYQEEYDLIEHLTGKAVLVGDYKGMIDHYEAAQHQLFKQFEQLGDGHMQFAHGELILMLEHVSENAKPNLILGWMSQQSNRLGWDFNKPVLVQEPTTQ